MGFARLWIASCEETGERLSEHLEGELRGLRRGRILRHLARCEHCRAILASLSRAVEHLRSFGRVYPPPAPAVADAVLARIRREAG